MDHLHRFDFVDSELDNLRAQGLYRKLRILMAEQGPTTTIDGKKVINLSSNNYLGLTTHPKLCAAAKKAIDDWGVGTGAVRTIIGTMSIHEELEKKLATFKHTEAALVFQSGFTANAGVLGPILDEGDLVISDQLNHASIIDGVRLTKADRAIYPHLDMAVLEQRLQEAQAKGYKKVIVVTDGVFSMDGDIAPLPAIAALCERYGAISMVDDAHASGVLGKNGRGTVNHFGLDGKWDIQVGTLSKAIGAMGGYVATNQKLRELMEHRARPFLFSTSHPPSVIATCMAALDVLVSAEGEALIARLWQNTAFFKKELGRLGFNTGVSETPITPVIVGEGALAMKLSDELFAAGVFAQGIGYPTVARDKGRVRTIVTATHTQDELERALEAFASVGKKLGIIGG
jgi:glycine C-acetyltransferase